MNYDYVNFNSNQDFLYNYNIFANNLNVGVGTQIPEHSLHILGNLSSTGNTNIQGNIYWKNKYITDPHILEYNINTQSVTAIKLKPFHNRFNHNRYEWSLNENKDISFTYHNRRDNTIQFYQSNEYNISNISTKTLYINAKYYVNITFVYIYSKINGEIIEPTTNLNTVKVLYNGIEYNLERKDTYHYKLSNGSIKLEKNKINEIRIENMINLSDYYIVFLGEYDFNDSTLWNINISNPSNIYVYNNVGIATSLVPNELTIKNNANISVIETEEILNVPESNINTEISSILLNCNNINTNILKIQENQVDSNRNIGIGTVNTNKFVDILGKIEIARNGNVYTVERIDVNSKINLEGNTNSILHNNNNQINFFNTNNEHNIKLKNLSIFKKSNNSFKENINISIKNKVLVNTDNDNNNFLSVGGNAYISENIRVEGNLVVSNLSNIHMLKLNSDNIENKNLVKSNTLFESKTLVSKTAKIKYLTVPRKDTVDLNKKGVFYYNTISDQFTGVINNHTVSFLSERIKNENIGVFEYNIDGDTELIYLNNKLVNSKDYIKSQNKMILPKSSNYINNYNGNKYDAGSIRYNISSMYSEIYTGNNWGKIKYFNSDSEIKIINIDVNEFLVPNFNSRIFNYEYLSEDRPNNILVTIRPYNNFKLIFKYDDITIDTLLYNNNSIDYKTLEYDMMECNNIVIESNVINKSNKLIYNIGFNFSSYIMGFIYKYEMFQFVKREGYNNVFYVRPTYYIGNNVFKLSPTVIKSTLKSINMIEKTERLFHYLNFDNKISPENTTFELYGKELNNSYYNSSENKFYIGNSENKYQKEIIFNNIDNTFKFTQETIQIIIKYLR